MNAELLKRMSALALLGLLSGCSGTPVAIVEVESLCRSWRHMTISKHDKLTQETASQIEGNNKARPAWGCDPRADRAQAS